MNSRHIASRARAACSISRTATRRKGLRTSAREVAPLQPVAQLWLRHGQDHAERRLAITPRAAWEMAMRPRLWWLPLAALAWAHPTLGDTAAGDLAAFADWFRLYGRNDNANNYSYICM